MDMVGQRASCLKQSFASLITMDEDQNQVINMKIRIVILKKLASQPFIYTIKAGQRKNEVIQMNVTKRAVVQADIDDMIETIVDIVSAIWETQGLINKAYDTESPAAPGNRGRLRSQERELWVTAAKHFREQYNTIHASPSNTSSLSDSYYHQSACIGSGFTDSINDSTAHHQKGLPLSVQSKYQKQYQTYMRAFKSTSRKLQCETFLHCDFSSKRYVSHDPILVEAQRKSGRQNISSNRNSCVTGMYKKTSHFLLTVHLISYWFSNHQSRRVHHTA